MSKETLNGRLVCNDQGRLFIHPVDEEGDTLRSIHKFKFTTQDGQDVDIDSIDFDRYSGELVSGGSPVVKVPLDEMIDEMVEVRWDNSAKGYVRVEPGDPSHNDVHHERFATISGTSGPLFDATGKQVYDGDPHHFEPTPDDPHYDADAPNKTKPILLPDDVSARATSHTEAYRS